MFLFGGGNKSNNNDNNGSQNDDGLGKAIRNKIVIFHINAIYYIIGRKYVRSNDRICFKKLFRKNFFLFKVRYLFI